VKHLDLIHLDFLYTAVSWVLLRWHQFFSLFMDKNSGLTWALSVVMLVVTARLLLFRMFVKQVHFQRRMQEMAPRMNEVKAKYKDDKQMQQQEIMKLQREEGFNPITGCLPIFLQLPIFLGLYHVLRHLSYSVTAANLYLAHKPLTAVQTKQLTLYSFSRSETISAAKARLFGAPLAASFHDSAAIIDSLGGHGAAHTRLVILPLLVISALATFATQLLVRRNQTTVPTGTNATMQKLFLWVFPVGVLASGLIFNFPLGVLLYWFSSNLWTLGQQAYIIRFHPPAVVETSSTPSAAAEALKPKPGQKPNYARTRPAKSAPNSPSSPTGTGTATKTPTKGSGGNAAASNGAGRNGAVPASDAPTPADAQSGDSDADDSAAPPAPDAVNPAAQRPQRSGPRTNRPGTRPAAKRPSQAKKRR
jgi:YidC/Oxa1 family membrane protein insertase